MTQDEVEAVDRLLRNLYAKAVALKEDYENDTKGFREAV